MKNRLIIILLLLLSVNFIFAQYKTEWKGKSKSFSKDHNVCYIDLGKQEIWGTINITLTGHWAWERTTGYYKKIFDIAYNVGSLFSVEPSNVETVGWVNRNFKIGVPFKDEDDHLKIPIYHINNLINYVCVFIEIHSISGINTELISISENQVSSVSFSNEREYNSIATKLGIGTLYPKHKLDVNGTIRAKEIIVENPSTADFVFEDTYKLKSLREVEQFIKKNKHLPDVASAKQMKKNGVKQGEMNAKLLQKIEELTLYMIKQNKQTEKLLKETQLLKTENKELKNRIKKLEE